MSKKNIPNIIPAVTGDLACACYDPIPIPEAHEVLYLVRQAFAQLECENGFACWADYGTCHRCSARMLSEELLNEPDPGGSGLTGQFAFYTSCDAQYLAVHGELFIAFGFVNEQPNNTDLDFSTGIGETVFKVLEETGLIVFWDFNGGHRIRVKHPNYKNHDAAEWQDSSTPPVSAFGIQ